MQGDLRLLFNYFTFPYFITGITDREKETVSSTPKIVFSVVDPTAKHSTLLKGIPNEPLCQPLDQHVLFGRGRTVGVFLNDETVSREHMTLLMQTNPATGENMFVVSTVSNTKPVFINGRPLHRQAGTTVLQTNDKLTIGQLEFIVTVIPGDSMEFYQVEFTIGSRVTPQQPNLQQGNIPWNQGGINSGNIIMANQQLGAVILPNNFGAPLNPAFNMNISTGGGVSQFGPMGAPFHGMPVAPAFQPMTVNPGMGQAFFQQQLAHQRFQRPPPSFQPQQESQYPGVYSPMMHHQENVPAYDRRQIFQTKQPSEQNEDPKQTELNGDSHISTQETGLPKTK